MQRLFSLTFLPICFPLLPAILLPSLRCHSHIPFLLSIPLFHCFPASSAPSPSRPCIPRSLPFPPFIPSPLRPFLRFLNRTAERYDVTEAGVVIEDVIVLDAGLEAAQGAPGGAARPRAPVAVVADLAWGSRGVRKGGWGGREASGRGNSGNGRGCEGKKAEGKRYGHRQVDVQIERQEYG